MSNANDRTDNPLALIGVRPGVRVWLGGHDTAVRRRIEPHLAGAVRPPTGPIDTALICPASVDEGVYFAEKLRDRLVPSGLIWIVTMEAGGTDVDALHERLRAARFTAAGEESIAGGLIARAYHPGTAKPA